MQKDLEKLKNLKLYTGFDYGIKELFEIDEDDGTNITRELSELYPTHQEAAKRNDYVIELTVSKVYKKENVLKELK